MALKLRQYISAYPWLWLLCSLFTALVLLNAWMTEDAFVTLRVLDNFVHGYGLRWNITERVQAYTHPMWLFWLLPFYFATREAFYTTILVSVATALAACIMAAWPYRKARDFQEKLALIILGAGFCLSRALIEFATSGLEGPLSYMLLSCFFYFAHHRPSKPHVLILIASLIGFNRLDHLLLVAPIIASLLWYVRGWKAWQNCIVASTPLLLWFAFSFLYYGFFFPNTYYAKTHTGISLSGFIAQGWYYLVDFLFRDPVGAALLFAGLALPIFYRKRAVALFSGGLWLYTLYILSIGGDFMSGRFFAAPVFFSVLLLAVLASALPAVIINISRFIAPLCLTLTLINLHRPLLPSYDYHGIINERRFYENTNQLLGPGHPRKRDWSEWGMIEKGKAGDQLRYLVFSNIGMYPYYGGPNLVIIDQYGLSEPLLARLPIPDPEHWRPGHFHRDLPALYPSMKQGGKVIGNSHLLSPYYTALRIITQEPVFSVRRLETLFAFHMGWYDPYLHAYLKKQGLRL